MFSGEVSADTIRWASSGFTGECAGGLPQSVTITLTGTVDPSATGSLTNRVRVAPPPGVTDPNPGNNTDTDTDTLTPEADLSIMKTDGATSVVPGTSTTYTIVVSNAGPSAVSGAAVLDSVPIGAAAATWAFASATGICG